MRVVAVVTLMSLACAPAPCVELGQYEFFAVRTQPLPADAGANCPAELEGTLDVRSTSTAHLSLDGGLQGDCSLTTSDNRPQYACQVSISCVTLGGSLSALSFVDPIQQEVVASYDGPYSRWSADGCTATYTWAMVLRGAR